MVKFSRSVSVNKHNGAIYTCRRCDQIFCEKITFCRYKNRKIAKESILLALFLVKITIETVNTF